MSNDLPEHLKLKLYKKLLKQEHSKKSGEQGEDPEKVVYSKLTDDRALELMEKVKLKYHEIYRLLIIELYKAIKNKSINEINGLLLYNVISTLGLDIKPEFKLKFVKHGKEVDIKDYIE